MKKILILTTLLTLTAYTASSCGSKNDEPSKEITEPNKAKPEASAAASSVKPTGHRTQHGADDFGGYAGG